MLYARVTYQPRRHRRVETRAAQPCAWCAALFTATRTDALYCSARCKQAAWRAARPRDWAVVWWVPDKATHDLRACWSYHQTRERAQRAAPPGEVFGVVNIRKPPWISWSSVEELIRRSRPLIEQRIHPLDAR